MCFRGYGKISLYCLVINLTVLLVLCLGYLNPSWKYLVEDYWTVLAVVYSIGIQLHLHWIYRETGDAYEVAWRLGALGFCFGLGVVIAVLAPESWSFFVMCTSLLSFFYISEYFTINR